MKMRIPWLKLPVYDCLAEYGHLPLIQIGALHKLTMLAWTRAGISIPNDHTWIKARLGLDDAAYQAHVRPMLAEFWVVEGDDLILPWLRAEAEDAAERSFKAQQSAKARWDTERRPKAGGNVHPLNSKGNL